MPEPLHRLVTRALRERPFYIVKYSFRALAFTFNHVVLRCLKRRNVNIGRNPRVLTLNPFRAELPGTVITVGNDVLLYRNCEILATGKGQVVIGDACIIGSNFRLYL